MVKYLLTLAGLSSGYAAWLNTDDGYRFSQQHTAESVGVGVGLTLLCLYPLVPKRHWNVVLAAFGVAGMPMVVRSLLNRR